MMKNVMFGLSGLFSLYLYVGVLLFMGIIWMKSKLPFSNISSNLIAFFINIIVPVWDTISKECKDLITRMLRPAARRLTGRQVLEHEWLKILENKPNKELLPDVVVDRLNQFAGCQKIQIGRAHV